MDNPIDTIAMMRLTNDLDLISAQLREHGIDLSFMKDMGPDDPFLELMKQIPAIFKQLQQNVMMFSLMLSIIQTEKDKAAKKDDPDQM